MVGEHCHLSGSDDPLELIHCHKTVLPNLVQSVYQVCFDM
jgi:hypothetical protein